MQIKINSVSSKPKKATDGSVGYDIFCVSYELTDKYYEYDSGVSLALPPHVCCLVLPRSSISDKGVSLTNSVGLIDTDYRGTIKMRFTKNVHSTPPYKIGERIGQLLFIPFFDVDFVDTTLPPTLRGDGGFGSTN